MEDKLTPKDIQILKEVVEWWKLKSSTDSPQFEKTETKVGSVRMSKRMYDDAEAMAKSIPNIRSFSRLAEILVWEFLGKGSEYLKPEKGEK